MPTPPLSLVKEILRKFPPTTYDDMGNCQVCDYGDRNLCRPAAIRLVRETAATLGYGRLIAPLGDIVCLINQDALWDEDSEYIAMCIMDRLEH